MCLLVKVSPAEVCGCLGVCVYLQQFPYCSTDRQEYMFNSNGNTNVSASESFLSVLKAGVRGGKEVDLKGSQNTLLVF